MSAVATEPTLSRPVVSGWVLAAIGVLAGFLVFGFLASAFVPAPSGPASSSYATIPRGVAAWADLLAREGHPVVQLRRPLSIARLEPASTVVALGVPGLAPAAARNLARFVRAGGSLVLEASRPARVLPELLASPPTRTPTSARAFAPAAPAPETAGVRTVRTAGAGAWLGGGGERLLADSSGGALLLVRVLGRGRIDLLADASPLQNRLLASGDNAQLGLDLAGGDGRSVVFAEALHGFGAATGLAALPNRAWVVIAGLFLAAVAWALARGRRLGPAEATVETGQPPRSAYVDALARAVARGGDAAGLGVTLRAGIAAELARRHAHRVAGAQGSDREALVALGVSAADADLAVGSAGEGDGRPELLALARTLARLRREP